MTWNQITPSPFPWERAALDHVRSLLPERHPYQAWSNFTFVSDRGHVREVDLLVATPNGLHLVEIKSFQGRLRNQGSTWILESGRRRPPFDSPVPLADQKAKELKGLLGDVARAERLTPPFVRGSIFLSERGMRCDLEPAQRHHVYGPQGNAGNLDDIGELLLAPPRHQPPDPQFLRRLDGLLRKVGIHRTVKSISIGPWRIDPQPYESGPTWQDHHARRPDQEAAYRRARIYLYERQEDDEARSSVRHAAQREFAAGQGIQHPGLLVPTELADHEMGPALLIDQSPDAMRLDHWLVENGASLDLPARLGLVRQLAEAVRYAHDRRLVHRALSPRAVIVQDEEDGPRLRIGEWQAAARGLSSSSTRHRVDVTTHAGRHVGRAAQAFLAPEFREDADGTTAIDVFGLGAVAYLVLTGHAPASTQAELIERLVAERGLHPAAVDDGLPDDIDALVAIATDPVVGNRFDTVEDFLTELAKIERAQHESVHPEPDPDPYDAQTGDVVAGEYEVERLLGTGATARALLVRRDHEQAVLKIARDERAAARLHDEATVLADLAHDHVVRLRRGVFRLARDRQAIEVTSAGGRTLAHLLRTEGALLPDALQRFGGQLLDAVAYLERHRVRHRDIKPDNIGVLTHPKRGTSVVLFDFSLAGVPDTDVTAGTHGYRDPFLGSARRPAWDDAAERWGAAVTLHEMASRELPTWGDDGTDPRFVDEVTLSEEVLDPALRDPLTSFFRRALAREVGERFGSAGEMRRGWDEVFARVDEVAPATTTTWSDDPEEVRDDAAAVATLDTALDAAGLSPRAVSVAQRLGAATVRDLLGIPVRDLWLARGLSKSTRDELLGRTREWRDTLASDDEGAGPVVVEVVDDDAPPPLDHVADALLPPATGRGVDQVAIVRRVLGLPDGDGALPDVRWPTTAAVGATFGITGQRVSQIVSGQRSRWGDDPVLSAVRRELVAALRGLGRVATARELADQLLALRGCTREEDVDRRRAYGYAVLRAAIESDDVDEPCFATRRHRDRLLVALQVREDEDLDTPSDAALLEMSIALGDRAEDLARREPLPTPVTVVRELAAIASSFSSGLVEQRLVRLAASASGSVLSNSRLELYRTDLEPVRAIRLSQAGASIPADGHRPEVFAARVAARFPGLAPLPDGAELVRVLKEMGLSVEWTGTVVRPVPTEARSSSWLAPAPASVATADPRLERIVRDGGVRIVTARRSTWARARARIADATGVEVRDAGAEFAAAVREIALERGVRSFATVLAADAADASPRAQTNLAKIVALALDRLEARWSAGPVLVLDGLTPFGRYDGAMAVLERLMACARVAGRDGGPRALVLLCVTADERNAPHVDRAAIGMVSSEEWLIASPTWLGSGDAA